MVKFSICLMVYAFFFNYIYVNSNSIDKYVKDVCGGENTCYGEWNSSLPSDSCCRPCECNDICREKGTCCSGMIHNQPTNVTKQVCLPSVTYAKMFRETRKFPWYYVRARCPENYVGQFTKAKCEKDEPESLLDIPFVSTRDGKIIYKNRHCAACFGEFDVIMWEVVIDRYCMRNVFLDDDWSKFSVNASFLMDKLTNACSLSFERPHVTLWKYTICYENVLISSCPEANSPKQSSDNITEELKEMCTNDKSSLTFFHSMLRGYANVYCYLCNKGIKVTCDSEIPWKNLFDMSFLLRIPPLTESREVKEKKHVCDHQEFYDEYFGECVRVRCPRFEVPMHGRCVSVVGSSKLNYRFHFELIPMLQPMWENDEITEFSGLLPKKMQSKLKFNGCRICSASVKSETRDVVKSSIAKLYLEIVFTTAPNCQREKVLSTASQLEENKKGKKNTTLVVKDVPFYIEYIWSQEKYRNLTRHLDTMYRFNRKCPYLLPSRFENCPKLMLSPEEYSTIANKSEMTNVHVARNDESGYDICVADYEAVTKAENSDGKRTVFTYLSVYLAIVLLAMFAQMST